MTPPPPDASQRTLPKRRLALGPLVFALYFMASGGPYGIEELARKVGFRAGILIFLVLPFLWSLPTALMVGELAAVHPDEGGYYVWVRRALGPFWGFQEAWLSFAASIFDMAIYPTLFALYLDRLVPSLHVSPVTVGVLMAVAGVLFNLGGSKAVGGGSAFMAPLVLGPFVVLSALAFASASSGSPPVHPPAAIDWSGAILIAMWNTMGWDNASTVAGEVVKPERNYPLGVLSAVGLVTLAYVVPLLAMDAAHVDPSSWETGAWADVARTFGGAPLAAAVVTGGMVSSFAMYNALCLSYSRLPAVLAEDGLLPGVFGLRLKRNDAPWVAIVACAVIWTLSLGLPFERLVSLDILLYGTSLMLEFVALVVLRRKEPSLRRPFRVPGGAIGVVCVGVGPLVLLAVALAKNSGERIGPINALVFGLGVALLGPVAYAITRRVGRGQPGTVDGIPPRS